ncbi:carboxyltransferase domain-containing protein [Escherichia coli]
MQRARCYLIGETAVVLELEPPVTLASQKRIWRLAQRLVDMPNVVEDHPGMNNITVIPPCVSRWRWMPSSVCNAGGRRARPWNLSLALLKFRWFTVVQADRIWRWSRRIAG